MKELFLRAARGERTERPPVWMMRQAGRYLPEYRELRDEYTFLEAISTPDVAAEITLQPWRRFRPDGVVMYSDILTVLEPLGFDYHLESGVGPVVENPVETAEDTRREQGDVEEELWYVGELLERLTDELGEEAAVLGFAGGPFTLSAYVCEGTPSRSFTAVRRLRAEDPEAFRRLLRAFTDVLVDYVTYQENRGADAIQLFDTYAGLLTPADYREFLLPLHREVLEAVDVPTIVFVRNASGNLDLLADSGADVVGLDWTVEMADARAQLGDQPVQGNLDPATLFAEPSTIRDRTREVIEAAGEAGHILNLGHGLDRHTPVEGVEAFFEAAKSIER
ncbi:uroporphyrinogen decarboxylase [Halalkaliarchaeum desulfuricum]|uniref:Uroporphyrinogen decarboxylase n=1 Tax=Halalkaliarchaeum desulfuricum TaxID=2055893 RepID=A0A343TJ39_9EURY|nr:uroporphyrinogen decarboxylase [Halalkaliarchaeum desulfuricum]AUX09111.1 uroporphyrinogen decarboxylase [Halalkaliarchaeum desulfuricum]